MVKTIYCAKKPIYFCKTSGTTSGTKYIPIAKKVCQTILLRFETQFCLISQKQKTASIVRGKMIFLQGSPILSKTGGIFTGRLSGIVAHHIPSYLTNNSLHLLKRIVLKTGLKVDKIVDETIDQKMSLISGIPPWVQMYFEKLNKKSGKLIKDIFPHFDLFIYGGVNYGLIKTLLKMIGKSVDSIELYPSSEGFMYQDSQIEEGMYALCKSRYFL